MVEVPSDPIRVRLIARPLELRVVSVAGTATPVMGRTITRDALRQLPPLGEPDIFRAAVFLPAVSQPNDLRGRIHLAGSASDETGVRLDGHPLEDPFHLLGVLGAFNLASLEKADVLIHRLPANIDGRLGGSIELETRRPSAPTTELGISVLSSGLTMWRPQLAAGFDVLASGRVTYIDKLVRAINRPIRAGGDEMNFLGYYDGLARLRREWSNASLEAIGFTTHDSRSSTGQGAVPYTWGESLGGIRYETRAGQWSIRGRASFNRATARLNDDPQPDPTRSYVFLDRDWVSGAVEGTMLTRGWRALLGAGVDARRTDQTWSNIPQGFFTDRAPRAFDGEQSQVLVRPFAEVSKALSSGVAVTVGSRLSLTKGRSFVAPLASLIWAIGPATRLSLVVDTRHQFDAELEEPREGSGKQPLFLLSTPRAVRTAALELAGDSSVAGKWEVAVFGRRYLDRTSLRGNPRAFTDSAGFVPPDFPEFDRIPGRSYGGTVSFTRTFARRSVVQGNYTFQRVMERTGAAYSPTAWDAPHALNLIGSTAISSRWVLNAAWQWRSGAATTPVAVRVFAPDGSLDPFLRSRYIPGERNSARLPAYRRLDVGVRREWRRRNMDIAFAAQILNLFARRNLIEYDWAAFFCAAANECSGAGEARKGLPILPSLGVELKW